MGKTYLPKFRIDYSDRNGVYSVGCTQYGNSGFSRIWETKYMGKVSAANLQKGYDVLVNSYLPGGANEHIGLSGIPKAKTARVVNQKTGETVLETELKQPEVPMFQVY
jgi:hypothetical protein